MGTLLLWPRGKCRGESPSLNHKKIFSLGWGYYVSNNTALMAGNCSGWEFYGVRPPSIPTQSLCVDKPVSKSIGLRTSGLLRTGRGRPALPSYFRWTLWKQVGLSSFFFFLLRIKYVWKLCNPQGIKNLQPSTKIWAWLKKKKNNHGELLLSKVCFRKLAREWDAESVEPSALIWAEWGRKLAPRCETKKGWGEPLRRRQHLRKEPWGHFVILRYKTSPGDLQEKASLMLSSKFNRSSLYTVYFFF